MANAENHLIELLPSRDRRRLLAMSDVVELGLTDTLCEAGELTRAVYFPIEGFISLVSLIEGQPGLEVGMVGREGMLGVQAVLGVPTTPLRAVVQGGGRAHRIDAAPFKQALADSDALQRVLQRYVYVLMAQLAGSAACLRFHQIGPRLARWLLMSQDRAHADSFHLTQAFVAYMLGVRRVGITVAAGDLQRRGLIVYHRGQLEVLDRSGLEAAACVCYAADCKAYDALLPAR